MKILPVIIGMKLGLVAAAAGVWAYQRTSLGTSLRASGLSLFGTPTLASRDLGGQPQAKETEAKVAVDAQGVPVVPAPPAAMADYSSVRQQLESMRQDVSEKLVRLKLATEKFDASRRDSEEKLALIQQERQILEESIQKEKTVQKERIEQALAFVEKMEPRKAAPVLEGMDRDLVLELFKRLKPKTVTKFLEAMKPKKATEYMEYYSRIRSGREYELLRDMKVCSTSEIPESSEPADLKSSESVPGGTDLSRDSADSTGDSGARAPAAATEGAGGNEGPGAPTSPVSAEGSGTP